MFGKMGRFLFRPLQIAIVLHVLTSTVLCFGLEGLPYPAPTPEPGPVDNNDHFCKETHIERDEKTDKCVNGLKYIRQGYRVEIVGTNLTHCSARAFKRYLRKWRKNPQKSPICKFIRIRTVEEVICCNGWQGDKCDQAVCVPACSSNAQCVSPNQCECKEGYGGASCEKTTPGPGPTTTAKGTELTTTTYHTTSSAPKYCAVGSDQIKDGKTSYIERDDLPGLTTGDLRLEVGDHVEQGTIIRVDECNECRCTDSFSFKCYDIDNRWDSEDQCASFFCVDGFVVSSSYYCRCPENEFEEPPNSICCHCPVSDITTNTPPSSITTETSQTTTGTVPTTPTEVTTASETEPTTITTPITSSTPGVCVVSADQAVPPYFKEGDRLEQNSTIRFEQCYECECTETLSFKCYFVDDSWVDGEDDCVTYVCVEGKAVATNHTRANCACPEDELVKEPSPECCSCRDFTTNTPPSSIATETSPTTTETVPTTRTEDTTASETEPTTITTPITSSTTEYCVVGADQIKNGSTPYIEKDDQPGLTADDERVKEGDHVEQGVVIRVDECNECRCTDSFSFECNSVPNSWTDEEDECMQYTCNEGVATATNLSEACNCGETKQSGGLLSQQQQQQPQPQPNPTCCHCPSCAADQFQCFAQEVCIPVAKVCDGNTDCEGGSDERDCPCDGFRCMYSKQCIPAASLCNGSSDCEDGSDEYNCPVHCNADEFKCVSSGNCVPGTWRCDDYPDCGDGSDEFDCRAQ